ncbi:PAS domain-containing protein [Cryptosporangium japonicum]|uniref:PAS domain-containing protein n=1 Tax=Cryptosporangium japonicum TaxID=80872 RepID=UPI0031CF2D80
MAAKALHAPMGLVVIVGDGHLVETYGFPEPLTTDGHPADLASLFENSPGTPVTCTDVRAESQTHPLAHDHGVRAFVTVALHDAEGRGVGSLTVLDDRPRPWTESDLAMLADIAALVDHVPAAPPVTFADLNSQEVLEAISEAFVALDIDARVTGWNTAAHDLFGYTAAEAYGQPIDVLLRARYEGQRPVPEVIAELLARPSRIAGVVEARHRDGQPVHAHARMSVLHSPRGAAVCVFLTDITAQVAATRAAEAAATAADLDARTQRGFADTLLDSLDEGVVAVDRTGHAVIVNRALREIHQLPANLSPDEAHRAGLAQLRHLDGTRIDPADSRLVRALAGQSTHEFVALIRRHGHPDRYLSTDARPIVGPTGRPVGAVATIREITEQYRAQQFRDCQLAVARVLGRPGTLATLGAEALGLIGDALGWSYLSLRLVDRTTDTLHRVAVWHPAELRLGDLLPERLTRSAREIPVAVWASGQPIWEPDLARSPYMQKSESQARARTYADRGLRAVVSVPILDSDEVLGVLTCFAPALHHDEFQTTGLLLDFATQAGQFLARRRADELAAELRRARTDFTALIGHDMRTPLTTIATYNQLLLDDPTPRTDTDLQLLHGIDRNTTVLRELVDGLLDITALECDDDPLPTYPVDLTALISDAHAEHDPGRTLRLRLEPAIGVHGDPDRLRQLADKLLTLALDGSEMPMVTLRRLGDNAELTVGSRRRLTLSADGFSRANTTGTGDADTRTGIALVLARVVAERHGGTLTVTEQPGGSTFVVLLPLAER